MVGVMKTTTEEDEFIKRNTDCVYFLASPLTCKKGAECEYRHSDIARINPRDCWYWLNGNCLNPKCAFRHPPLDGFLGAEDPTPVGPSVPQAPVKQGVACIFFQKGFCLKGHLCPFLHGQPNVFNNKPVQPVPPNPVTNPSKISSVGPEKPVQEQKFTKQEIVQKPIEFTKQVPRVQSRNGNGASGVAMEKKVAPPPEEPPRYRPASVFLPPVMNESPVNRSNNGVYETHHVSDNEGTNGKDDEYSREPTPGFDVLVDTELGESEYYPNEQQFGERSRGPDFDFDVDRNMYNEQHDFNHFNKEGYSWEDNRESSNFERKRYPRNESPDPFDFDKSDLRHRISKQRRGNNSGGLRSVVSRENPRDGYTDRIPRRNGHHNRHHDRGVDPGQLSSRLRGRIKIPGRSMSPGYENGSRVEREIDMGRQYRSRYSPGRQPNASSNHNRFRDRIKGRASDDFNNERRDYRSSCGKSQNIDDGQTLGKRKYPRVESQQSEVNVSFEGPKPLSEILKRKRGSVICSVNNEEDNNSKQNNRKERKEILSRNMVNADNEKSNKAGSFDENALLDQDVEAYDHNNGDYDYEQLDGEDYNLEEGEEEEDEGNEIEKKESEVYS